MRFGAADKETSRQIINDDIERNRMIEPLLTPKDVQQVLGLGKSKVYRMLATGELPAVIVASGSRRRSFRVRPSDLEEFIKEREVRNERRKYVN